MIIYNLLGGYAPFIDQSRRSLYRRIKRAEYEFHEIYWSHVSEEAKDLISSLLFLDPSERLSASGALKADWIIGKDRQ